MDWLCARGRVRATRCAGVLLAWMLAAPLPVAALTIQFEKIADTATPIPGGVGTFTSFGRRPSADGGGVAFRGEGEAPTPLSPTQQGVYVHASGSLVRVADKSTAIPGGVGSFEGFAFKPSLDGASLAWNGDGSLAQEGIYRDDGAGASLVADRNTLQPGGAPGELFDLFVFPPAMDGGAVAFHALGDGGPLGGPRTEGIYLDAPGGLGIVADSHTVVPGTAEVFDFLSTPDVDAGRVLFRGRTASGFDGVYRASGGTLEVVADETTAVPGGSGTFVSFGGEVNHSGDTALFRGTDSAGTTGLFRADSLGLTLVADENTLIPEGGGSDFNIFSGYAVDHDVVVFEGIGLPGSEVGLYTDFGGSLHKILDLGDPLDGKTLSELEISEEALDGLRLTFWARFSDGSEGIFVATIPEPGSAGLLALGLLATAAWRRGRR